MAGEIAKGAADCAALIRAEDCTANTLLAAQGYVFVCPENLGAMSGSMKDMFDRCYYEVIGRIEGRPYATAIAAGSAGQGAELQIDRIVTGWRLRRVTESLIINLGAQTVDAILAPKAISLPQANLCHELGMAFAEGIKLGIF
jgi:multimeric flavodoxin WrbA